MKSCEIIRVFFKIITKIPFVRKNTILKGIFDIFFEKPKFYGWGMRTMHENPWIDNFQESTFRKSCIDVKNFQFTMAGINKKTVEVTWLDLEEYLLNLKTSMDSENYSRGQQTVDFVERVRDYYYLLLAQNCEEN